MHTSSAHPEPTENQYSFAWNPRPDQLAKNAILCSVLSAFSIVISWLGVLAVPGGFLGVGALYFASIFYAVTTYLFGGWGLIASFIGAFVGSGLLTGMPIITAMPFAAADIIEPLIPFLILRGIAPKFGVDPLGRNLTKWKNYLCFVFYGAALPPFLSGLWGVYFLKTAGFVQPNAFTAALVSWWAGAFVLLAVFVPPLCKVLGRTADKTGMACRGIWS